MADFFLFGFQSFEYIKFREPLLTLHSLGCCPYCCLRFVSCRNIGSYQEEYDKAKGSVESIVNYARNKAIREHEGSDTPKDLPELFTFDNKKTHRVCPLCFNWLEILHNKDLQSTIFEKIRVCGYDYAFYSLTVTVAVSVVLREYGVWTHLRRQTPQLFAEQTPFHTVVDLKEATKWILGPLIDRTLKIKFVHEAPFRVCLTLQHSESNGETKWLDQLPVAAPRTQRKRGRKCKQKEEPAGNDTSLASALKRVREVDPETFTKIVPFPFPVLSTEMGYTVGFLHESVFVGGRYVKLARDVSQTPWYADATAAVRGATETIIAQKIAPHFQADAYRFSASGREDVDVRMLGNGRPFVIEFVNPHHGIHSAAEYFAMRMEVNKSSEDVNIYRLQEISKANVNRLRHGDDEKRKHYRALVWIAQENFTEKDVDEINKKFEALGEIVIQQKTPIRVLHRRTNMTRTRSVYYIRAKYEGGSFFSIELVTQAGTYVKEFVHGDLGRTVPSLSTILGKECDILQLDVTAIDFDFPPNIKINKKWAGASEIVPIPCISSGESNDSRAPEAKKSRTAADETANDELIADGLPAFPESKVGFQKPETVCMELIRKQDQLVEQVELLEEQARKAQEQAQEAKKERNCQKK